MSKAPAASKIKVVDAPSKGTRRPTPSKRGEAHMSMRVHAADKRAFTKLCKQRDVPQSELFRRFVAAALKAGAKTKVVTIRITGYSPV